MILKEKEPEEIREIQLAQVNARLLGKKIKTKVMVSKVGEIGAEIYERLYTCPSCNAEFKARLDQKLFNCFGCGCRLGNPKELKRDFKDFEVEEVLTNLDRQPERMYAKMVDPKVMLTKRVERSQAGDIIEIEGTIQEEKIKRKIDSVKLRYYIMIDKIEQSTEEEEEEISEKDLEQIIELSKNEPLIKLRDSLAPNIHDMEKIKMSLLLQMVRGPENMPNVRPRVNILMVGNAAVGKSKLAEAVHNKLQKSIYGSGESMSKAGLVMSMEKDEITGRWGVRAGTICRANNSVVIIDELDKLAKEDRDGLHTPMEMGKVIVDKAGIHCELNADASILACCNPKNGKLDMSKLDSIQAQINLPEPLLTRFDLIWIIPESVDKERDEKILRSLLTTNKARQAVNDALFRKYIKYAMKIEPEMGKDVQDTFVEIVTNLRQAYTKMQFKEDKSPMSFRQAGALIRLAVASAKLRLSKKVELRDLKLAEELLLDALESAGFARDFNAIEYAALYGGTTVKRMKLDEQLRNDIRSEIFAGNKSEKEISKILEAKSVRKQDIEKIFTDLRKEGTIVGVERLSWIE